MQGELKYLMQFADLQQSAASKQGGFVETARVFISTPCASDKSDMINMTQMVSATHFSGEESGNSFVVGTLFVTEEMYESHVQGSEGLSERAARREY